jgi:superfamily I DNA/RNA helicase
LAETTQSIAELQQKLTTLFSDEGVSEGVVMCSTIHRAKGLEAGRVWVLEDTLKGGNLEEENLRYVAVTRAKDELVLVTKNHQAEATLPSYGKQDTEIMHEIIEADVFGEGGE